MSCASTLISVPRAPVAFVPLIDPNLHSSASVPPHGAAELAHPEPGLYTLGEELRPRADVPARDRFRTGAVDHVCSPATRRSSRCSRGAPGDGRVRAGWWRLRDHGAGQCLLRVTLPRSVAVGAAAAGDSHPCVEPTRLVGRVVLRVRRGRA